MSGRNVSTALLLLLNSCYYQIGTNAAQAQSDGDLGTRAAFDADDSLSYLRSRAGNLTTSVCYDDARDRFDFPGPAISSTTGASPLEFIENSESSSCDVQVREIAGSETPANGVLVQDPTCSLALTSEGAVRVEYERSSDPSGRNPELSCLLRISLYLEGYSGALRMKYSNLFVEKGKSTIYRFRPSFVGHVVTDLPAKLARKCPGLEKYYFQGEELKSFVIQNKC